MPVKIYAGEILCASIYVDKELIGVIQSCKVQKCRLEIYATGEQGFCMPHMKRLY